MNRLLPLLAASVVGCTATGPGSDAPTPALPDPVSFLLQNAGVPELEGHTPRGFQGQGTGLFVGDNLNAGFPEGDGVQAFLSFSLEDVVDGTVLEAELRALDVTTAGTPLLDLGPLSAERVAYDAFSSALWDLEPEDGEGSCVLAEAADDPFACDVTQAVADAWEGGRTSLQLRLRLELAGDSDGQQDLVVFNPGASNDNEPGLFEVEVSVRPDP